MLCTLGLAGCSEPRQPKPIASEETTAPAFIGDAVNPQALQGGVIPGHPHMAPSGVNAMHSDGYSSDVHPGPGPTGRNPQVISRVGRGGLGGMCATATFDKEGRLVLLCGGVTGLQIQLLDPQTLELLAKHNLPARPSTFHALVTLDPAKMMSDTSGGAYYYLDNEGRVVLADSEQQVVRLAHRQKADGEWEFYKTDSWDLKPYVPHDCFAATNWFPDGECDPITAVMPDFNGLIWWVTRQARVGTLNPETGDVKLVQLNGEEIQNGFSVAEDGVYIVSDYAMYSFKADSEGTPEVIWRETYDRGSAVKVGAINQGSGTTPTLLGEHYVTVTDNADERINLLVYRRAPDHKGERLVCKVPLFNAGASATDNSMIAYNRSIILENNHGYQFARNPPDASDVTGGISRIDVREDESGCDTVWTSKERSPSVVPKMSLTNGLAYFYTFDPQANGENVWYLMALDYKTGRTAFKIRTGAGKQYDNNWAPITLGPDGTLYVGTLKGLLAIRDGD